MSNTFGSEPGKAAAANNFVEYGMVDWNNTLPDTSLVVEDEPAKLCQAKFSRLQAALGLKRRITADGLKNLKYGDDLPALEADVPTGCLERKGNAIIMSMELKVSHNAAGAIANIDVDVARFSVHRLAWESPGDFAASIRKNSRTLRYRKGNSLAMPESELGLVRYYIQSMLHPCTGEHNEVAWGIHDHDGHKQCFWNNGLIVIFSNKEAMVRELQLLGCDPEKDFSIYDLYDLRELNRAYQVRYDASIRGPEIGGRRAEIPKSDQLSTLNEILKARGCFSSTVEARLPALDILAAAIKMASDDATNANWVRTLEQIDGGDFSRPRVVLNQQDADNLLLELEVARSGPSSKRILDLKVEGETNRFRGLTVSMRDAFLVNIAQRHGFTNVFARFPRFRHIGKPTARIIKLVQLASEEARVYDGYTYQAPIAIEPTTADTPDTILPGHDEGLDLELALIVRAYSKAGRDISTSLVDFLEAKMPSWPAHMRDRIYGLYSTEQHIEDGVSTRYPKMRSNSAFESLARAARQAGWTMTDEVAGWFITAITGRRELRNWYDRLPHNDSRFEANEQHEAWLQTMIEVVVALVGHRA